MKDQDKKPLTEFKVFVDGKEEALEKDGKTTTKEFIFNEKIVKIVVKKEGYEDSKEAAEYIVIDGANKVEAELKIKEVKSKVS